MEDTFYSAFVNLLEWILPVLIGLGVWMMYQFGNDAVRSAALELAFWVTPVVLGVYVGLLVGVGTGIAVACLGLYILTLILSLRSRSEPS